MDETQHEALVKATRRTFAHMGAALGSFYTAARAAGMPPDEVSFQTGFLRDVLFEKQFTEVRIEVKQPSHE